MIWTAEVDAKLQRMWADGYSGTVIGYQIGCSKNAVIGRAHRLGLSARRSPINRGHKVVDHPKKDEIKRLLEAQLSPQQISAKLHVHPSTIRAIRDEFGIPLLRPERRPKPTPKAVTIPRLPSQERPMVVADVHQVAFRVVEGAPVRAVSNVVALPVRGSPRCEYLSGETKPYVRCENPSVAGRSWCVDCMDRVFIRRPASGEAAD
jgi:GcrA cell cycle regulator